MNSTFEQKVRKMEIAIQDGIHEAREEMFPLLAQNQAWNSVTMFSRMVERRAQYNALMLKIAYAIKHS